MQRAVGIGPAAVITGKHQLLHPGRKDEFRIGGVFLLQQALGGGVVPVAEAVFRRIRKHVAIGQAHRGVGVRIHGLAFLPFHEGGGEILAGLIVFGFVIGDSGTAARTGTHGSAIQGHVMLHERSGNGSHQPGGRIIRELLFGCIGEFLVRSIYAVVEEFLHIRRNVHRGEVLAGNLDKVFRFRVLAVELEQRDGFLAVQRFHIVAVTALGGGNDTLHRDRGVTLISAGIGVRQYGVIGQQLDIIGSFGKERDGAVVSLIFGHIGGDVLDRRAIAFGAGGIGGDPGFQRGLFLFFAADDIQVLECKFLTLPLLPAIGAAGVLVGVFQLDGRVGAHGFPHQVLADGAGIDADAVGGDHLFELGSSLVALRTAWITHDHGEVIFLRAFERNFQALGRTVGHVVDIVVGRHVVLVSVNAEHREVAGVAGPHPVVGLTAEFAHRGRRSTHETDVTICAVYDQVIDVVIVEAGHDGTAARVLLRGSRDDLATGLVRIVS